MIQNIRVLILPLAAGVLMLASHSSATVDVNDASEQSLNLEDGASDGYYYGYNYNGWYCNLYPEACGYGYTGGDRYYGGYGGYYGRGWGRGYGNGHGWGRGHRGGGHRNGGHHGGGHRGGGHRR